MSDVFKEQIVKREATFKDTAIKACLIILVVLIAIFSFIYVGVLAPVLIFAAGFGAFFLMSCLNVEYEYIFTSGELDIDIIYNKARRKRVFSANMKKVELMAHIDDKSHEGEFNAAQETRDYSGGTSGKDTYAFLITHDGKKIKVIIDPNEKMLKAFNSAIARRKLHLRPGVVLL
jgi:hypothetical protein